MVQSPVFALTPSGCVVYLTAHPIGSRGRVIVARCGVVLHSHLVLRNFSRLCIMTTEWVCNDSTVVLV